MREFKERRNEIHVQAKMGDERVFKHRSMKDTGIVQIKFHAFLTSAIDRASNSSRFIITENPLSSRTGVCSKAILDGDENIS
jgi:hypothetical protein